MIRLALVMLFAVLSPLAGVVSAAEPTAVLGELPKEFDVIAIGTYTAPKKLEIQIDESGHDAVQAEVVVNYRDKPVLLVLTAYEPTVWRVGRTAETKVAGILVSGYCAQALIGTAKSIPYAISSHKKGGRFEFFLAYDRGEDYDRMNDRVQGLVGRKIDRFINTHQDGVFYVGERPADLQDVAYSDDLSIKEYVSPTLSGLRAVEQLVKDGGLRRALPSDVKAWEEQSSKRFQREEPDRMLSHYVRAGQVYVVLRKLTLPAGMTGAHSRAFIVPDDVPFPDGPRGHNAFYLMNGSVRGLGQP